MTRDPSLGAVHKQQITNRRQTQNDDRKINAADKIHKKCQKHMRKFLNLVMEGNSTQVGPMAFSRSFHRISKEAVEYPAEKESGNLYHLRYFNNHIQFPRLLFRWFHHLNERVNTVPKAQGDMLLTVIVCCAELRHAKKESLQQSLDEINSYTQ